MYRPVEVTKRFSCNEQNSPAAPWDLRFFRSSRVRVKRGAFRVDGRTLGSWPQTGLLSYKTGGPEWLQGSTASNVLGNSC